MEQFTRIHPDLPLCWEDSETVRIGFETPIARIKSPSAAAQRLMGSLRAGVSTAGLRKEARRLGATTRELDDLLGALAPALITGPRSDVVRADTLHVSRGSPRIVISDDGREVTGLSHALESLLGYPVDSGARPEATDLVIHVERFLEPLERAQRWLILNLPHLIIRFSDQTVQVGPIIVPPGAPCHSCLSLSMVADDPALPALAAQLHGKIPRSECRPAAELAAVFAGRLVDSWRSGAPEAHRSRWEIPIANRALSGAPVLRQLEPFPGCCCGDSVQASFDAVGTV